MRRTLLLPILLAASCGQAEQEAEVQIQEEVEQSAEHASLSTALPQADVAFTPVKMEHPVLHRLIQVDEDLYSGAQPHGAEAFAALKELGIKTVVCVDGARPDIELAAAEGLRYIHVPIGYDAIEQDAGDSFYRTMQEAEGPLYFHCHHGKHRGPAAVAVALRASTGCDAQTALKILELAETSPGYPGLWRDVAAWTAPRPDQELPELVAEARVADFASGMAVADRTWDNIKALRKAGWETPASQPDLSLRHETSILLQQLEDCAGRIPVEHEGDPVLRKGMEDMVVFSRALMEAAEVHDLKALEASYRDVAASCKDCHRDYRNE
ncbi:MAG: cytochrome c [Planctomycetota bacterium]